MWIFDRKTKRLVVTLSKLSKAEFRDIYAKVKEFEETTRVAKEKLINSNLEEDKTNLHAFNVEYIRYLKLEDSVVSQKPQMHWFKEGDANSNYFHSLI